MCHLKSFLDLYGATFYEQIANDFISTQTRYKNNRIGAALMSWYSEVGFSLIGKNYNKLSLFIRYRNYYGRGMNFIERGVAELKL